MIKKELDEVKASNKFSQAGIDTEKQMSFYLRRAFENDSNVLFLNGMRLEMDGDSAQIDHLIVHRYGMIIIESKSITGKVVINNLGEWTRQFGSQKGMRSPVKQAEMQAAFLKKYLSKYSPPLPKDLGIQRTFDKLPIDVLVAISDKAIIERPKHRHLPNVCKADLIPDRIKEIIESHHAEKGFLSLSIRPFILSDATREALTRFLIQNHRPLVELQPKFAEPTAISKPAQQPRTITDFRCRKCGRTNLEIRWGRYGYYFKCGDCDENTPINEKCQICNQKLKIRKDKEQFFGECKPCGISNLLYTNPA